jgi:RNA polymerase sigma-70 factor (ECF subfamily)
MKKTFKSKRDHENVLIKKLIQGDPKSFEHVVEEYHNIMLSVARAIVGESIADEVVQDAWISAIKALPKFEQRSSLKTWLLQIVSNGAKSRVQRENRYISLGYEEDPSETSLFDQRGIEYQRQVAGMMIRLKPYSRMKI